MIIPFNPFYSTKHFFIITAIMLSACLFVAVITHYFPPRDITEVRITITDGNTVEYRTTVIGE